MQYYFVTKNYNYFLYIAIFIYLVPEGMKELAPLLIDLVNNHNVRIVTYVFTIPGLTPIEVQSFKKSTNFYLYKRES